MKNRNIMSPILASVRESVHRLHDAGYMDEDRLAEFREFWKITTDEQHAQAIIEIQRLWNAEPGTPEHDRLEALGELVDAYEEKRWPF